MADRFRPSHELEQLTALALSGQIDDLQVSQLEALLHADREAIRWYRDMVSLQVDLRMMMTASRVNQQAMARIATEVKPAPLSMVEEPAALAPRRPPPVLGFLGNPTAMSGDAPVLGAFMWTVVGILAMLTGAVVLMVVLTISGIYRPWENVAQNDKQPAAENQLAEQPAAAPSPAARLARTADCKWVDENAAPAPDSELASGHKLQLTSGLAELAFHSGATVLLQGPASFEIGGRKSGYLYQGSLSVTCETPAAKGFAIDTPGMKYTDLGTEFGVMVAKDGEQEVHVFRGQVAAESEPSSPSTAPSPVAAPAHRPQPLVLSANQAIRIAAPGKPIERIAADEKRFVRTEQMTEQVAAAKEKASRPAIVVWKDIGEAPGVVGMAALGGKLFACTNKKLMVCDPNAAKVVWKTIDDFTGVVAMGTTDKKLFAAGGGELYMSDDVNSNAAWKKIGHAWCIVGMAGAPGKIYALVDTKEPGKDAAIMVRDTVATDVPWNGTGCRPPAGALAFTVVDKKFFAATKDGKLFVGNPTQPNVQWRPMGDAAGVTVLAGGDGKLFAATKTGKLLMWEVK